MSHDTEKWWKIWRKSNFLFQKLQEFGEFWSEHLKVSKICILIGPFRAKYITFDLEKYRGVIFHGTEKSCKIWRKVLKIYTLLGCFWPKYIMFDLKSTEELYFMTLECDAKFEEKLTCGLEHDMRNLANVHQSTRNSEIWDFHWILLYKVEKVWGWDLWGSYMLWLWRMIQNLKRNWLVSSKLTWGIYQILTEHSKISKSSTLMGCFWQTI